MARHRPFAPDAKELLARTLRQAVNRRERQQHVLVADVALASGGGAPAEVLAAHGLTYPEVRAKLAS
jgi:hypothetical protein